MFLGNDMTDSFQVRYFDGQISTPRIATIRPVYYQQQVDGFIITWQNSAGDREEKRYLAKDCEHLPAIGASFDVIMLSDGAKIEFIDQPPTWLQPSNHQLFAKIAQMEQRWAWIGASIVIICLMIFATLRFGIPYAAHHIAQNLPADTLMQVGDEAEEYVLEMTEPSTLSQARQNEIIALYNKLNGNPKAKVLVRGGGDIGANALAIPNNTIIITDELIKLSDNNNEILAVLAHEQGHLVHRHSLEQAISGLGIGVLIVVITGDASDILLSLPTLLASAHYSQKAEMEADLFAIHELKRLGISPNYLASFFEKMTKEYGEGQGHWTMLSTHPDTSERIAQAKQYAQ